MFPSSLFPRTRVICNHLTQTKKEPHLDLTFSSFFLLLPFTTSESTLPIHCIIQHVTCHNEPGEVILLLFFLFSFFTVYYFNYNFTHFNLINLLKKKKRFFFNCYYFYFILFFSLVFFSFHLLFQIVQLSTLSRLNCGVK